MVTSGNIAVSNWHLTKIIMETFRFLNFDVYKKSKELHRKINKLVKNFHKSYYYLAVQLKRASLSVSLNIAEGSAKSSDKDFARYLQNSMGSINEVMACLDISFEAKLISKTQFEELSKESKVIAKQLGSFIKKLKPKTKS